MRTNQPITWLLVVAEPSRLGREQIETAYLLKMISEAGVAVWLYLEKKQYLLDTPYDRLLMAVTGFADELERQKAAQRTLDAMLFKARKAYVVGGSVFGYSNVSILGPDGKRSHTERQIVEDEADVIRHIFQMCANGIGVASIARRLNEAGAASPKPQQGRQAGWCPSNVRPVLYRELYRGVMIYGKTKKRNAWGKWSPTSRTASEWQRIEVPHLRIVPDELWEAAHTELARRGAEYLQKTGGKTWGRSSGRDSKYLLTGLICCPSCGGPLQVESAGARNGKRGKYVLACATFERKGKTHCNNRDKVPMTEAEVAVLESLRNDLLRADVLYAAMDRALDRMLANRQHDEEQRARIRQRLMTIDAEIQNLANAIATGAPAAPLSEAITTRQGQRQRLECELAALDAVPALTGRDRDELQGELEELLTEWRAVLLSDVQAARPMVRKLLADKVRFIPEECDGVPGWRLKGEGTVQPILSGRFSVVPNSVQMVARPEGHEDEYCVRVTRWFSPARPLRF